MNFSQQANQKKTSIKVNDITPIQVKTQTQKQKKNQSLGIPLKQNQMNFQSMLPSINTVVSNCNLSTISLYGSEEVIRKIVKQQIIFLMQDISKNNFQLQNDFNRMEHDIDSIWKSTKKALDQTTYKINKQTSQKLEIILGGIRKAMAQTKKQIKMEILNEIEMVPSLHNKIFKDITDKVTMLSQHVFQSPYIKPFQYEMKQVNKQLQMFNQCNMTLFTQLNKIKSAINQLQKKNQSLVSSNSNTSIKNFRPLSAACSNIQFKQKNSKVDFNKSNQSISSIKVGTNVSFQNMPSGVTSQSKNHLMYQVDSKGRLQDGHGNYLLDDDDKVIIVDQKHIKQLRKFDMLTQ